MNKPTLAYDDQTAPPTLGWSPQTVATLLLRLVAIGLFVLPLHELAETLNRVAQRLASGMSGPTALDVWWLAVFLIVMSLPAAVLWFTTPMLVRRMFVEVS